MARALRNSRSTTDRLDPDRASLYLLTPNQSDPTRNE
jgi:hypothetical protein